MEDIRYAHYRLVDVKENKMLTNGGVTLAIGKLPDGTYRVAGAKCHEIDHYCKKEGRPRAKGRLSAQHPYSVKLNKYEEEYVRVTYWYSFDHKPSLDDLNQCAAGFYVKKLPKKYKLVHSGVFHKQNKYGK